MQVTILLIPYLCIIDMIYCFLIGVRSIQAEAPSSQEAESIWDDTETDNPTADAKTINILAIERPRFKHYFYCSIVIW
jgi:hypothetical protein